MRLSASKATWQGLGLALIGILFFAFAQKYDAFEAVIRFADTHEAYELDEILLAIVIIGILSIVYGILRIWDLRTERRHRQMAERQVDWMALHDQLTGLKNRHSLDRTLAAYDRKASAKRSFSLLVIDLDGFKRINDLNGHHAGDLVLQVVAERLREQVPDTNIFRLGGDEFLVIVDTPSMAAPVARALLQSLNQPVPYQGVSLDIGASIGLATWPDNGGKAVDCLRDADAAMYAAKAAGRGVLRAFDKEMAERLRARGLAERNLRHAIAYDGIKPFYQPIIDLHSGKVCGFEALARWYLEDGTAILPLEFIPLAEESGLIMELTDRLLRQACEEAGHWPKDITLSFNISPVQLQDKLLGLRILRILMETGFDPRRLEIEITETALINDIQTAATILSELRTAGISVALDDFGTGYSSLAQLSNFSFDKIKIDRSFVASFKDQERQEKIVKAIVGLGIGLDVPTTAEGIETSDQLASLAGMGCTYGQGYLFGRALPADEVRRLLEQESETSLRNTIAVSAQA
ncbi:EAL domain-containing protein [Rhizobium sp. FY34]|uniref:putative bifunctional diguanylate cyclase/phosphodiesterase n=1 Tax=Rhizobium sp. FY34 TaxID=2562309 RepID=UPI00197EA687|nr:EAL domain-containing protein [Rhizobium sp. FY34]